MICSHNHKIFYPFAIGVSAFHHFLGPFFACTHLTSFHEFLIWFQECNSISIDSDTNTDKIRCSWSKFSGRNMKDISLLIDKIKQRREWTERRENVCYADTNRNCTTTYLPFTCIIWKPLCCIQETRTISTNLIVFDVNIDAIKSNLIRERRSIAS